MGIQVDYNPHVSADTSGAFSQQDSSGLSSIFDVPVDQNIADATVANMDNNNTGSIMANTGPKRRGGWPKGKKRKRAERKSGVPKAPMTGYVRFLNSRREQVKSEHPNLSFPEITKFLGNEWSKMKLSAKQARLDFLPYTYRKKKFLDEAEADKRRYVEELKAYQCSDGYRSEASRESSKKSKLFTGTGMNSAYIANDFEDDESDELFCRVCNQYFSSLHNKREHMFGRQHLQNVTNASNSQNNNNSNYDNTTTHKYQKAVDNDEFKPISTLTLSIDGLLADFYYQNQLRESEIKYLKKSLPTNQRVNIQLQEQAENLKAMQRKLNNEIAALKEYGATLNQHVDSLRLLSTLSLASHFENYTFP
ncbi:uncharacterized protein TRIADDRAFT_58720 [Trichoplax adhaerens]|uniref:HMG box domain-containing protein n=1 Tax=Trichoplax adhaerens TaxID=10228 RepID=B3S3H2_TRIAD|nr:hypothetical protein TRIADDRAFT_58720 [Trichoplax adhaerens]EDV22789.1 hypothetical protein TRIADDRAFT_58720 [Trichoplax adhaerens]|eukprot:XP_002114655.1 hypothetical protein TRIADDRAFT_58720 [Trichoplax adhaerens]